MGQLCNWWTLQKMWLAEENQWSRKDKFGTFAIGWSKLCFLNTKAYTTRINENISKWEDCCRMSLKLHFSHSHFDFFPENIGAATAEEVVMFYQDIQQMETRYHGFWNEIMMSDYCWRLFRDHPNKIYKRKSYSQHL